MVVSVCYMQGNEGSPVRKTDLLLISPSAPAASSDLSKSDLVGLLDQSWTVRYKAHQEILRRRGPVLRKAAERFLKEQPSTGTFSSLIYLAAIHGDEASVKRVQALAADGDKASELAIRVMAEFPSRFKPIEVEKILAKATSPRVQHALMEYLHALPDIRLPESIVRLAADPDAFVRQSAAQLLARRASAAELTRWAADESEIVRQGAVNAAGFHIWHAIESTTNFPEVRELARANQMAFAQADGPIKLPDLGKPIFIYMPSEWWRDEGNRKAVAPAFFSSCQGLERPVSRRPASCRSPIVLSEKYRGRLQGTDNPGGCRYRAWIQVEGIQKCSRPKEIPAGLGDGNLIQKREGSPCIFRH